MTAVEQQKAEGYLRGLESLGFEVKPLWRELTDRVESYDRGTPPESDLRYSVPKEAPKVADHLTNGRPQVLAPQVLWSGYHYTLSPGQRRWFREFTGMTPSQTVTVSWIETWPGTQAPRSVKVVSDVHVDPRVRRHLLTEWVIRDVGAFFEKAAEFDAEEKVEKVLSLAVGPVSTWSAKHSWAVSDLCGVKLKSGDIEIVELSPTTIRFQDTLGRVAMVSREEFLATVTDYERLYRDDSGAKRRKPSDSSKPSVASIADLMSELEKGLEV